jgi:hypothetical protein
MAGLVPAIHVFLTTPKQDVDARDKRGMTQARFVLPTLRLLPSKMSVATSFAQ